jgi:protease I
MELTGKNIAILVDTAYQEMEVWYPYYRFQEAGAECVLVGAEAGKVYASKVGYPATAQLSYDAVSAADFDGVVVPGGYAPDHICHGPWVLCSAGILKGRRATCFFAIKDDVVNAGALYEDAEVVTDRNLVTSRKPEDLPAFCRASIGVLVESPVLTT